MACFCGSATTLYPRAEPASPEAAAILKGDSLDEPAIELGAPMEDDEPIPSRLFQPTRDAGPARRGRESYDTVKTQTRQPAGGAAQEFFALGGQGDRGPLGATISLGPGTPIDAVAD